MSVRPRPPLSMPPTWRPASTRITLEPSDEAESAAITPPAVAPYTTTSADSVAANASPAARERIETRSIGLKIEPHRKADGALAAFHRPAGIQRAGDGHKSAGARVGAWIAELRSVRKVERFSAELHAPSLVQFEVTENTEIRVDQSGPPQDIAAAGAKTNRGYRSKGRGIEERRVAANTAETFD